MVFYIEVYIFNILICISLWLSVFLFESGSYLVVSLCELQNIVDEKERRFGLNGIPIVIILESHLRLFFFPYILISGESQSKLLG